MQSNAIFAGSLLFLLAGSALPAAAQDSSGGPVVYRREVFQYQRAGRPDPFRSLLNSADLGVRFEDITLLGVIHSPNPNQSVAILSVTGQEGRVRARVGSRIGNITIAAIQPRRIDVLINEFGVARRESLQLKAETEKGTGS